MSTSDPQDRPAPSEPASSGVGSSDARSSDVRSSDAPSADAPSSDARSADASTSGEGVTVTDDTAADDTAHRHAQARPMPTPPEPEPADRRMPPPRFTAARADRGEGVPRSEDRRLADERTATSATPGPAVAAGAAGAAGAVGAAAAERRAEAGTEADRAPLATPATVERSRTEDDTTLFPDPNAPRTIGAGTHVLGLIVGLVLPVVAALVTLLGVSRILSVEADGWAARVEVLGMVLVALGALLLGAVALLSLWTPWVGYAGGIVLTLAGALALFAPGIARSAMLDVVTAEGWQPTVVQTSVAATSGTLVVIGVLVLASGIVSHVARRHGIHLGAFRERNSH